ncbi:unnamed protein product [Kuraishia capsulata CBS 1993]|uniref:Trafficking protein particle complex subunit n=1 Tax=Kuraishia capsulata CBS 1993 TaxID=1382522 RepID=W6MXK2_9ASCO|nr:uncharacterized protein KUCA_T00005021001 [Kuraishia capsulata CBS 1993]CDK29035.1 unnamed protein product [Kuraishia capsulata CBS 1993]
MQIYTLYILNKSGGLVYHNDFQPGLLQLTTNESLVMASTIHSIHAISSKITPANAKTNDLYNNNKSGLRIIETENFQIYVYQTITGVKFIGFANDTNLAEMEVWFKKVYLCYSDYVMKNPFQQLDMPIKNDNFDRIVRQTV